MKATGIIFTDTFDSEMGELTKKRATASLPFGGRYRLVDFMLSNLVNSGVGLVGVLTRYNYQSLLDHLGNGSEWDLNRKNGGLIMLPPFISSDSDQPRGKLETLYNALPFLKRTKSEYIIICDATVVGIIDFEEIIEAHIESGADITAVVSYEPSDYSCNKKDVCYETENGKVTEIYIGCRGRKENFVGMGIYVLKRERLIDIVEDYVSKGRYNLERDFVQAEFVSGNLNVNLFLHTGILLRNTDTLSYFKNNLKLINIKVFEKILRPDMPVYTKVRDEIPSIYGENCEANNCFIADGCIIDGKCENSILFRNVTLCENTSIKNCIVMQGATISEGTRIENAIIEKNTVIEKNKVLIGAENSPVLLK